jgi:hypothetical protein
MDTPKPRLVDDQFRREIEDRENARTTSLRSSGGGGNSGDMTDDWKKSVEEQLKTLHDDFRKIIGWIIAAIGVPLIAIIGLYVYNGTRFDATNARIDLLTNQASAIRVDQERQRGDLRETDARINGKLDRIGDRLSK